jgi:membrane protease YdiL (CAAX protease family)
MNASFSPTTPEELSAGAMVAGLALLVILCAGLVLDIRFLRRWRDTGIPAPAHADRLLARHWHWRDALWLTLVMAVFIASLALVGKVLETPIKTLAPDSVRALLILQNIATQALALGLVLHLQHRSRNSLGDSLGGPSAPLGSRLRQALVFYLAAMPVIAGAAMLSSAMVAYSGLPPQPQPVLSGFIDTTAPLWFKGWLLITAVAIAPLVEEVVFRGVFFPALARHRGIPAAVVLVSMLFAFIHGHPPAALPLFVVGTTLATAYLYTGSLLVPIFIHAIFNAVNLAALLLSGITYTP